MPCLLMSEMHFADLFEKPPVPKTFSNLPCTEHTMHFRLKNITNIHLNLVYPDLFVDILFQTADERKRE